MTALLSATFRKLRPLLAASALLAAARAGSDTKLPLHAERSAATDLAIAGGLAGVPAGEARYVQWKDLRALKTREITVNGEFVKGDQRVTIVMVEDVWAALPVAAGADSLMAICRDGYASIYPRAFVGTHKPFVVLEIEGRGPDAWPPAGMKFDPGPYVISVSASLDPDVASLLDANHKRPWGVQSIEFGPYEKANAPVFAGRWAALSPRAKEGREIWIHSCASCHRGPSPMFGGTKSDRPFEVIAAHAAHNADYFRRYVRQPQAVIPTAKMEAHPHYTDAHLDALIAFLAAEPPGSRPAASP